MKGYIQTGAGVVPEQWIDKNGHMNIAAYMALFDQGSDILLQTCGCVPSLGSDTTFVAGRILIDHRKELFLGDKWEQWSGIVAVQHGYLTITHRLRSASSIRATCDIRAKPFSVQNRVAVSLDPEIVRRLSSFRIPGQLDRFGPG